MKKNTLIALTLILALTTFSCKKETSAKSGYVIDSSIAKIGWTAYKTTSKVPVSGEFTKITINSNTPKKTAKEAINGAEFSIPVSSVFSNNPARDSKLQQFFFGVMANTELLTGKVSLNNDDTGKLTITMNAITASFPIRYTLSESDITISGDMDMKDWKGLSAIESLNKACFDLHKGTDGVSKTWNEVKIDAKVAFKQI